MNRQARVTAAYATVKILDPSSGSWSVRGFYQGGVLPESADPEDVERLVRREYAEWADEIPGPADPGATIDEAARYTAPEPVAEPVAETTASDQADTAEATAAAEADQDDADTAPTRPAQSDSKAAWVDYVVAYRTADITDDASEADARADAEAMTKADLIKQYG